MIDVIWSEIILIALIAFILLGPKDFLFLLKMVGRFFAKLQIWGQDLKMAIEYEENKEKKTDKDENT